MEVKDYSIQELCDKTGLPRRTIHFYSQQGILPPPSGAGMGAHYDEGHLLRLLLIPILRQQGLRLDDIRARLDGLEMEALRALYVQHAGQAQRIPASLPPRPAAPQPVGQAFTHYPLPAGMTLIAPDSLSPSQRIKLNTLLETARRLFSPSGPYDPHDPLADS
jgi:DNA-binding transcriptional MerR regulator